MKVQFGGLALQYRRLEREIDEAVRRVLESGYYIGSPELEAFERSFAAFASAPCAAGVANGTDAIALALLAAGVQEGDEVIIPAVSAYPTTVGVVQARAVPVFVDVRPESGLIDPALVEEAITPRTRAVLPVHLYGVAADLGALEQIARRRGLALVEDCAQAHGTAWRGRPAGSVGVAAAWSFYPTKNLGAVGDAGAVTTGSPEVAEKVRRLRNYGQTNRYEHALMGVNSRLDPLQAAILSVKLRHLGEELARRRALASRYDRGLAGLAGVAPLQVPEGTESSRHLYPIRLREGARRETFQKALAQDGIETLIHYPIAMPDQAATRAEWRRHDRYPAARGLVAAVVSLPLHPELEEAQVDHVIAAVRRWDGAP
jgi:dTDP-4-amino-4,6-dideoxygalactose transaminase